MPQEMKLVMKNILCINIVCVSSKQLKNQKQLIYHFCFPFHCKEFQTKVLIILNAAPDTNKELDPTVTPISIDPTQCHGSLHKAKDGADTNCWASPSGTGFMIRGKTYLKDNSKVGFSLPLNYLFMFQQPCFSPFV